MHLEFDLETGSSAVGSPRLDCNGIAAYQTTPAGPRANFASVGFNYDSLLQLVLQPQPQKPKVSVIQALLLPAKCPAANDMRPGNCQTGPA